ncbi:MAG: MBL fold metallo-hydrolase [Alphaproteobacteria bacterium]|nr:MBL fold metallo-hydrolase [Alphaproteobacteria bacterium]
MRNRHRANAPGTWYIDTSCTDCSAARTVAPGLIVERDSQSVFARQPETEDELRMAWRARLLCPSASIHTEHKLPQPAGIFPEKLARGVFRLGYNAADAAGAHSFLIHREGGNFMVDGPRWAKPVVDAIAERGGLKGILLTHRDDIGDAKRYAGHFDAQVWIHRADHNRAPFAGNLIEGLEPVKITDDILAIPLPGHTKGSVAYLYGDRCLFTGDSLAWSFEAGDLMAWREFCWFSWREQTKSLKRLLDHRFETVLAGHGGSITLPEDEMRRRLRALVARMEAD